MVVKPATCVLLLACLATLGCRAKPHQNTPEQLRAGDYLRIPLIVRPRWKANGSQLAYLKVEDEQTRAFVYSPGEPEKLLAGSAEQLLRFVTWGPGEGELTVGVETPGNPNQQIYRLQLEQNSLAPLAVDPRVFHEIGTYSRDGRRATISSNRRDPERYDVYIKDLESGVENLVFEGRGRCLGLRFWGKDTLVVVEETSLDSNLLHLVNLQDHSRRTLGKPEERCHYIKPSPKGDRVYLLTDRHSDRPYLGFWNLNTGKVEPLLQLEESIVDYTFHRGSGEAVLVVESGGQQRLFHWDGRSQTPRALAGLSPGYIRHLRFIDRETFTFLYTNHDTPPTVMRWSLEQDKPEIVVGGDLGKLTTQQMTRPERVYFRSGELEIGAWLYTSDKNRDQAVVYLAHQPGQHAVLRFDPVAQWFVDQGYSVLKPDFRGSGGYGRAFEDLDNKEQREDAVADVLAAGNFLKGRGCNRVCLFGRGYGGYLATAALLRGPETFDRASALQPTLDLAWIVEDCFPWQRRGWTEELGETSNQSVLPRLSNLERPLQILYKPGEKESRYLSLAGDTVSVTGTQGLGDSLELSSKFLGESP